MDPDADDNCNAFVGDCHVGSPGLQSPESYCDQDATTPELRQAEPGTPGFQRNKGKTFGKYALEA